MDRQTAIAHLSALVDDAQLELVVSATTESDSSRICQYTKHRQKIRDLNGELMQRLESIAETEATPHKRPIKIIDYYPPFGVTILATAKCWRWLLESDDSPLSSFHIEIGASEIELTFDQ